MDHQLRRYEHPGKFEGGLVIDEVIYNLSLSGCDDECGEAQYTGWFGRLNGPFRSEGAFCDISATARLDLQLTPDELAYLASIAGAIVTQNSDGFISVHYFETTAELDHTWDCIVAECDVCDDDDDNVPDTLDTVDSDDTGPWSN